MIANAYNDADIIISVFIARAGAFARRERRCCSWGHISDVAYTFPFILYDKCHDTSTFVP